MTAGRPTKFNAKRANLIIEAVRKGNFITTAAKAAGVHQTTIDSWRRKGKEAKSGKLHKFYLALEEAEALGEMDAVEDWRELRKKSPEAIKEFLRRRYEHWNAPEKHEVKEEIGNVEDLINARVAKYIAIRSRTGTEGKPVSGNSPGKSVDQRRTNDKAGTVSKD
jgi:hypothetical protein